MADGGFNPMQHKRQRNTLSHAARLRTTCMDLRLMRLLLLNCKRAFLESTTGCGSDRCIITMFSSPTHLRQFTILPCGEGAPPREIWDLRDRREILDPSISLGKLACPCRSGVAPRWYKTEYLVESISRTSQKRFPPPGNLSNRLKKINPQFLRSRQSR